MSATACSLVRATEGRAAGRPTDWHSPPDHRREGALRVVTQAKGCAGGADRESLCRSLLLCSRAERIHALESGLTDWKVPSLPACLPWTAMAVAFIALCSVSGFYSPGHDLGQVVESQSASEAAGCRKTRATIVRIQDRRKITKDLQKVVSQHYNLYSLCQE